MSSRRGRERKRTQRRVLGQFVRPSDGVLGLEIVDTVDEGPRWVLVAHAATWCAADKEAAAAWLAERLPIERQKFHGKRESPFDAAYRTIWHERWPHEAAT